MPPQKIIKSWQAKNSIKFENFQLMETNKQTERAFEIEKQLAAIVKSEMTEPFVRQPCPYTYSIRTNF